MKEAAELLYADLMKAGIDVLLCDTKERPGVMFNDLELIGIPHRLVLSDRGLDAGQLEYKGRRDTESTDIDAENIGAFIADLLNNPNSV